MIIMVHGESSLLNCMMADQLIPFLPRFTIRVDEKVWKQDNGDDQYDSAFQMASFVAKQGYTTLMSFDSPDIKEISKNTPTLSIELIPMSDLDEICLHKKGSDGNLINSLQIFSSFEDFESSFLEVKDFVCTELKIDYENQ